MRCRRRHGETAHRAHPGRELVHDEERKTEAVRRHALPGHAKCVALPFGTSGTSVRGHFRSGAALPFEGAGRRSKKIRLARALRRVRRLT